MSKLKRSKNQIRRERNKLRKVDDSAKKQVISNNVGQDVKFDGGAETAEDVSRKPKDVKIDTTDPLYASFNDVFRNFDISSKVSLSSKESQIKSDALASDTEDEETDSESEKPEQNESHPKKSLKKLLKLKNRVSLANLKASTLNPAIVESSDSDALDPYLLVHLKSQLNTVPVPVNWSSKRDYLFSRRGIERPPFELPLFIRNTGIQEMRKVESQTLKQQQREKVQPKMGSLDIDYQKLHDAFFLHQSKPKMLKFGDIYYEGRETVDSIQEETSHYIPGVVSSSLRTALGLSSDDLTIPPPWLNIMLEIGKPPAYEDLLIPGIDSDYTNEGYKERKNETGIEENESLPIKEHWGSLEVLSSDESEEDIQNETSDDEAIEDEEEVSTNNSPEMTSKSIESVQKSYINEYGAVANSETEDIKPEANRTLYRVIKETSEGADNGLIKGDIKYSIDEANGSKIDLNQKSFNEENDDNKVEETEKIPEFKF